MYFVYILRSKKDNSYYTGVTENLKTRVQEHNRGSAEYSSSKTPFGIAWFCAFSDKQHAYTFESYLKSHSGIAFRNKHLL
jgi:predicted GIY-YIG superfamily endonuclease